METSPAAHKLTKRFIAGLELEDALRVAEELRTRGMLASLDYLGENVTTPGEAMAARDAYVQALEQIHRRGLEATISVKVTALGLDISEQLCRENTEALVQVARSINSRVEFDMEASEYTDRTISIVRDMHARHQSARAVIQAYLYRTEQDIRILNAEGVPVRLCKGAYREPPDIAWPQKTDVDRNFTAMMKLLVDEGTYPALATHDEAIVNEAIRYIRERGLKRDAFEFQMLYGVRRPLQRRVVAEGYRLRLYVPYGAAWYPYFMRRLAERPANVVFLAKSFISD